MVGAPDDADQREPAVPRDPKTRVFLQAEMEKYLFGEGAEKPAGYTPAD
jgi:Fe-S cluster biosynthesis and repair protein YggX